ncbi:hypothetical protein [Paracidobacterium acidisoli]|uniref:DUF5666 domain-containing protein n=1 Tax=Paracidobacterium acidisoli TaxID=2303751 RepID=A0A372IU80_9BACT|nr:hypothetical protein [Paracidobacterium acidisoli]MBT9329947.1 hypothetical protein [Paracidobacterium acidisoli]
MKASLPLYAAAILTLTTLSAPAWTQTASAGAQTQGSAAAGAGQTGASASTAAEESTQVSAELTKKIDTKNAKVGDEVAARTTNSTRLSDGTRLPRGSRLIGKVTEVQAKEGRHGASHLAFAFDHAVMHDGRQIPVHAMLTSLSVPTVAASAEGSDDGMGSGSSEMAGGSMRGAGRMGGGSGGALGGAAHATGGLVSNTAGAAGSTADGALQTTAGAADSGLRATGAAAGSAAGSAGSTTALGLNRIPVGNLPGVTFSSGAGAGSTTALDASGRNIDLESGSQMTLNLSAAAN